MVPLKQIKMKFLLLIAVPFMGLSQNCPKTLVGVGITAGYSTKKTLVGEGYLAVKTASNVIIYPLSVKIHGAAGDPTMPVIWETRLGYKVSAFEPYVGYGYHLAGQDNKREYRQYRGFYPGVGLISHVYKKIILSAELSRFDKNKVFTIQLGLFDFN